MCRNFQVLTSPPEIESLLENLFRYMNHSPEHDVKLMVNVHSWLVRLHPFAGRNGRIVRLILIKWIMIEY